jgi:hypothetical protein
MLHGDIQKQREAEELFRLTEDRNFWKSLGQTNIVTIASRRNFKTKDEKKQQRGLKLDHPEALIHIFFLYLRMNKLQCQHKILKRPSF